jgi:MGT family glycosyltransferase
MTRFLLAAMPAAGHIGPLLPIARELVGRGHEVAWYTGSRVRRQVEATGARFLPHVRARDLDAANLNAELPGRADKKGFAQFRFDVRELFIASVPDQVEDLEAHVAELRPDVLVAEPGMAGACTVISHRHGIPWATCNITVLTVRSRDTAPFGLGLRPPGTAAGRLRNALMAAAIDRTLFAPIDRDYHGMRARLGLPPTKGGFADVPLSPHLFLQPTAPSFEYPRSDLPPQVHFVGALLPPTPADFEPPPWWDELDGERPLVLVTQGTVATGPDELLLPTLEALREEPVRVVAVTGGPDPATLPPPPANAHVERFVPFSALMPRVCVLVSNGGYGGLHYALSHGVPLVVVGASEEKPELVARVNWSGVGVGMRTRRPRPDRLRTAVRRVLSDPAYARRAGELREELAACGGASAAADLLEGLTAGSAPRRAD